MSTEEVISDTCLLISSLLKSGDTLVLHSITAEDLLKTLSTPRDFLQQKLTTTSNDLILKTPKMSKFFEKRTENRNDEIVLENLMLTKFVFFVTGFITCTFLGKIK